MKVTGARVSKAGIVDVVVDPSKRRDYRNMISMNPKLIKLQLPSASSGALQNREMKTILLDAELNNGNLLFTLKRISHRNMHYYYLYLAFTTTLNKLLVQFPVQKQGRS